MRRLSLVFLIVALAACGKSPVAPKLDGDPFFIAGTKFTPGLYPDSAHYTMIATTVSFPGTDSAVVRKYREDDVYHIAASQCVEADVGSGFVDQLSLTVDWYITVNGGADTLAHYTAGPFDPLDSPIPGLGDDPAHALHWFAQIDGTTPVAPNKVVFVASAGSSWPPQNNAGYCP